MCGRFAQKLPSHMLLDMYKIIPFETNVPPNYNVAPTDPAMVVRANPDKRQRMAEMMKWGLIPAWSKTGKMERPTFNAKCETAASIATFRNAFKCTPMPRAGRRLLRMEEGSTPRRSSPTRSAAPTTSR